MRKSARTQIPPFFDNDPYKVLRLILSGLESQIKENISEFNFCMTLLGGSNNTVKGYISFGKAKVLITVILPINVKFSVLPSI